MYMWLQLFLREFFDEQGDSPKPRAAVDLDVLKLLQESLRTCEAVFSQTTEVCRRQLSQKSCVAAGLRDLESGLLAKIFVEIAHSDRRWSAADTAVGSEIFRHIWGTKPTKEKLFRVFTNFEAQATAFDWQKLCGIFRETPELSELGQELATVVIRIAQLVAKADGHIRTEEADALFRIELEVNRLLRHGFQDEHPSDTSRQRSTTDDSIAIATSAAFTCRQILELPEAPDVDEVMARMGAASDQDGKTTTQRTESAENMLDDALRELDQLIGLESIKREVHELVDFLQFQKQREDHDLPRNQVSLHTCFLGNPGTGKTTVGRLLGRILQGLEILKKGHTVETDRSGLVAEYSGQTAMKSHAKIDEAIDGVLFIDEAYSLAPGHNQDAYGGEALQTLLKRIEDDRDKIVTVLAGYTEPMRNMLRSNPGLSSRFQLQLTFPDYTVDELMQIFLSICDKQHYHLLDATQSKVRCGFEYLIENRDEHFGNGRLARNVFEDAIRNMATRIRNVASVTRELLTTLHPEDIEMPEVPANVFAVEEF